MAPRVKLTPDLESLPPESKVVLEKYPEDTGGEYLKLAVDVDHPWRKRNTPEHNPWVPQFVNALGYSPGLLKAWLEKDWYMVRQSLLAKKDVQPPRNDRTCGDHRPRMSLLHRMTLG